MSKLSNNPQSVYNGFMSASRNMFLSSNVAIAYLAFSDKFSDYQRIVVRGSATVIFIISIMAGYMSTRDFDIYLKTNEEALQKADIPIGAWRHWGNINYTYIVLMIVIAGTFLMKEFSSQ